jgi:hypothetical protein
VSFCKKTLVLTRWAFAFYFFSGCAIGAVRVNFQPDELTASCCDITVSACEIYVRVDISNFKRRNSD